MDGYVLANFNNPVLWIVILAVVFLLFGGQKIPEMMKGLGQGMKEFKKGMSDKEDDELRKEREKEEQVREQVEKEVRARLAAEQKVDKQ